MTPGTATTSATRLFQLAILAALVSLAGCSLHRPKQKPVDEPVVSGEEKPGQVIDPEIARREVKVPKIRADNFEVGLYTGYFAVEDLQSHLEYGVRAAYHVSEDFFLEAEYGRSKVSDEVRRVIGQPFFTRQVIDLNTYGINLGYNLLPGEIFVGTRYAMTSVVYLLGGVGNTHFNKEDFLTYNAGFGIKVLPLDWLAVRLEARDRLWQSDLLGRSKLTNNFEMTLGLSAYF